MNKLSVPKTTSAFINVTYKPLKNKYDFNKKIKKFRLSKILYKSLKKIFNKIDPYTAYCSSKINDLIYESSFSQNDDIFLTLYRRKVNLLIQQSYQL